MKFLNSFKAMSWLNDVISKLHPDENCNFFAPCRATHQGKYILSKFSLLSGKFLDSQCDKSWTIISPKITSVWMIISCYHMVKDKQML